MSNTSGDPKELPGGEGVAGEELKQFIERIERVDEEADAIKSDRKEIFLELKGRGFDTKAVRVILRKRKKDRAELQEEEAILETYERALGMLN